MADSGKPSLLELELSRQRPTTTTTTTEDDAASKESSNSSSPSIKMKIKRTNSNSSTSSNGKLTEMSSLANSETSEKVKKRPKDLSAPATSSSSSSRSSSPRSTASPISQLPPFLLAAMTGGVNSSTAANGPRLDALLRQVAGGGGGPPSKKPKLNGESVLNGEAMEDSPSSVSSQVAGSSSNGSEMATMTEPDSLGPCEPGTAVKLQGIVWQETEKGLLVLNVTWKGKTYMGTLLDCHRPTEAHKWGPPRDPSSDKMRGKRGRNTRSRTPPVRIPIRKGSKPTSSGTSSPVPKNSSARAKLFTMSPLAKEESNSGKRRLPPVNYGENEDDEDLKDDESDENTGGGDTMSPSSRLIECPKPVCAKKFRDLDALKYHLSYAHNDLKKKKKSPIKKQQKQENSLNGEQPAVKPVDPKPESVQMATKSTDSENYLKTPPAAHANGTGMMSNGLKAAPMDSSMAPLDLQKPPAASRSSPAYSDISDEETPLPLKKPPPPPPVPSGMLSVKPEFKMAPTVRPQKRPEGSGPTSQTLGPPPQHLPPSMLGIPGFGMFGNLAAAMARYPASMMPPVSSAAAVAAAVSSAAKLQELQDRVMYTRGYTVPPSSLITSSANSSMLRHHEHLHLHLGYPPGSIPGAHGVPPPMPPLPTSTTAMTYSTLSRGLPPAHSNNVPRTSPFMPGPFGPAAPRLSAPFPHK